VPQPPVLVKRGNRAGRERYASRAACYEAHGHIRGWLVTGRVKASPAALPIGHH